MFHYSFSTVMMAVITSNLIIVLIALCFRHKKLLLSMGYKLLIVFLLLTLVRFMFPLELKLTTTVLLPKFLSFIITHFLHPLAYLYGIEISMWTIFECIWLAGIIYKLYRHIREYTSAERFLRRSSVNITEQEPYAAALTEACGKRKNSFRILKVPDLPMPCLYGIRHPRILLPMAGELTDTDLYYTLRHEVSHHYHHDLVTKQIINFLSIVYWWNPACLILKNQVNLLLEMRVDDALVKGDRETALAYLQTLINIAESSVDHSTLPAGLVVSLTCKDADFLSRRFEMICYRKYYASPPIAVALFALIFAMYLGSYLFTLESYYYIDDGVEKTFSNTDSSMYAIPKEDGTYDIFYGNLLIENTDSLEYYPDIIVYE